MLATKALRSSSLSRTVLRQALKPTLVCGSQQSRQFHNSFVLNELPYHIVVGMPALSPTMEMGTLAEWYVGEGQEFSAGDSLAKIETDKASIDFEAQDDGVVAKILLEAGAQDVTVGTPIMVTVEEAEDVAAFADFVPPAVEAAPEPEPEPTPAVETPPPPAAAAAAAPSTPPPAPIPPPVVEAAAPPPPPVVEEITPAVAAAIAPVLSTGWGKFAKINSPLAKTMSKSQQAYVEKYGTTGQTPL